jgi:hypothetical protein
VVVTTYPLRRCIRHVGGTKPFLRDNKQRATVCSAEHTREAASVGLDRLQHLPARAHPDTPFIRHVGIPDRTFDIQANAIRHTVAEIGPYAPIGKTAVVSDIKRVKRRAYDSATTTVELCGVTAIPFGKTIPSATCQLRTPAIEFNRLIQSLCFRGAATSAIAVALSACGAFESGNLGSRQPTISAHPLFIWSQDF